MNNPVDELIATFEAHITETLDGMHTSMPGRVESYDRILQRASVQPLVRRGFFKQNGERATELLPRVTNVPIEFFGGGDYALSFPVVVGMTCRLTVMSCSIDRFLAFGGEVDPDDDRRFHLSDAVAQVGLRDFAHALQRLPPDAWVMSAPLGARILLGSVDATEPPIMGNAFHAAFDLLLDAFSTFIGAPTDPPTQTAAQTAITTFKAAWATMLATKVRIE